MERALGRIAGALNGSGALWCVGASMLLNRYGLSEHPRDMDLLVDIPDARRTAALLGAMGEAVPRGESPVFHGSLPEVLRRRLRLCAALSEALGLLIFGWKSSPKACIII